MTKKQIEFNVRISCKDDLKADAVRWSWVIHEGKGGDPVSEGSTLNHNATQEGAVIVLATLIGASVEELMFEIDTEEPNNDLGAEVVSPPKRSLN